MKTIDILVMKICKSKRSKIGLELALPPHLLALVPHL
jgi:hypothetical protein